MSQSRKGKMGSSDQVALRGSFVEHSSTCLDGSGWTAVKREGYLRVCELYGPCMDQITNQQEPLATAFKDIDNAVGRVATCCHRPDASDNLFVSIKRLEET